MKAAGLAFMVVGFAGLLQGTRFAALSGTAAQQSSSASSADTANDHPHAEHAARADGRNQKAGEKPMNEQPGNRRASDKNHGTSHASLPQANRPNQIPKGRERSTSGNPMDLHQPGSDKSGGAAKSEVIQNETAKSALPVRSPSVLRSAAPSLQNLRHRSPNAAVVGGSANATTRNNGAINGTGMNRKP